MIENTDLWLAMRQTKYNRTINAVNELLSKEWEDPLALIEQTLGLIAEAMHAETGTFWIHQKLGNGRVYPIAVYEGVLPENFSVALGEGLAGKVTEKGEGTIVADCQNDPRWQGKADAKTGFVTKSMMVLPLGVEKECVGCIQIINKTDGLLFDDEDFELGVQLSRGVAKLLIDREILRKFQLGTEVKHDITFNEVFLAESEAAMLETLDEVYVYAILSPRVKKKADKYVKKMRQIFLQGMVDASTKSDSDDRA